MKELPLADQLTLATVRLQVGLGGSRIRLGTGFFFNMGKLGNWPLSMVITNKHVVQDAQYVTFHTSHAGEDGLPSVTDKLDVQVSGEILASTMVNHPDPEVDLCGVITWPLMSMAKKQGKKLSHRHINESHLITAEELNDLSAIEDVIVVGYPTGLWDKYNNRPISRRGITATHARLRYNGRAEFLVDTPAFGGSSGSPVFLYRPELHTNGDEFVITSRPRLLGILCEARVYTEKAVISNVFSTTEHGASAEYEIPLDLGLALQASRLTELRASAEVIGTEVQAIMTQSGMADDASRPSHAG